MSVCKWINGVYVSVCVDKCVCVWRSVCVGFCTFCAFTGVLVGSVGALGPVLAGGAGTLINVHLAQAARETWRHHSRSHLGSLSDGAVVVWGFQFMTF